MYGIYGRTENKKCLVSEPSLFGNRLNCWEVRKVDNDYDGKFCCWYLIVIVK